MNDNQLLARRVVVLIALAAEDPDAQAYRDAIGSDTVLHEQIDLRFGRGDDMAAHLPEAEVVVCGNLSPAGFRRDRPPLDLLLERGHGRQGDPAGTGAGHKPALRKRSDV